MYRDALIEVEKIHTESMQDLKFRILEIEKLIIKDHKNRFQSEYVDKLSPIAMNKIDETIESHMHNIDTQHDQKENIKIKHPWVKKLYKKILAKSHPDKNVNNPHIDEKVIKTSKEYGFDISIPVKQTLRENDLT